MYDLSNEKYKFGGRMMYVLSKSEMEMFARSCYNARVFEPDEEKFIKELFKKKQILKKQVNILI